MSAVTAYIGLGSNLADPKAQVRAGIDSLRRLPQTVVERCSALYASAPVGITAQPDFVNAACRVRTALSAPALMQALLAIEHEHGRVRGADKGGPRTLDLDLLLYGDSLVNAPDLVVPHPRLHERAFVLYPLQELDAGLIVPGRGAVADLLAGSGGQRVVRLESC